MKLENQKFAQEPHATAQQDRRRSQRVTIRVGVRLLTTVQGNEKTIEAYTLNVNDHGAMLICKQPFKLNERLTLEHKHTRGRIACRVSQTPQQAASGYQIAIEFEKADPGFWHIAFPPLDWKPVE